MITYNFMSVWLIKLAEASLASLKVHNRGKASEFLLNSQI